MRRLSGLYFKLEAEMPMRLFSKNFKEAFRLFFSKPSRAFSLIEVVLVVFILAFVFAVVIQSAPRKSQSVKNIFDKLIRLNNRLAIASKLHNKTYRLVLKIDPEGLEHYWVEKKSEAASSVIFLKAERGFPAENQEEPLFESDSDDEGKKENSKFSIDESFFKEPEPISPLLEIRAIEGPLRKEGQTEGLAYIYYRPRGLAEELSIKFFRPDNKAEWTLYLDPVTKNLQILENSGS